MEMLDTSKRLPILKFLILNKTTKHLKPKASFLRCMIKLEVSISIYKSLFRLSNFFSFPLKYQQTMEWLQVFRTCIFPTILSLITWQETPEIELCTKQRGKIVEINQSLFRNTTRSSKQKFNGFTISNTILLKYSSLKQIFRLLLKKSKTSEKLPGTFLMEYVYSCFNSSLLNMIQTNNNPTLLSSTEFKETSPGLSASYNFFSPLSSQLFGSL